MTSTVFRELADAADLGSYMAEVWHRGGNKRCEHCSRAIYYDRDSGYWLHAGHAKVDGHNGLFCSSEMWDDKSLRKYAIPR